ncbi:hypothetical protein [Microbacterium sp. GXF7504]
MTTDPGADLFVLEAARAALQEVGETLRRVGARTVGLGDTVSWASPVAEAFRLALVGWLDELGSTAAAVDAAEEEVRLARIRSLLGGSDR